MDKFKPGDKVTHINAWVGVGTVLGVAKGNFSEKSYNIDAPGLPLRRSGPGTYCAWESLLTLVKEKEQNVTEFKVGDKVRIKKNEGTHSYPAGTIATVIDTDCGCGDVRGIFKFLRFRTDSGLQDELYVRRFEKVESLTDRVFEYLTVPGHPERLTALKDLTKGNFFSKYEIDAVLYLKDYINNNNNNFCPAGVEKFKKEFFPIPTHTFTVTVEDNRSASVIESDIVYLMKRYHSYRDKIITAKVVS